MMGGLAGCDSGSDTPTSTATDTPVDTATETMTPTDDSEVQPPEDPNTTELVTLSGMPFTPENYTGNVFNQGYWGNMLGFRFEWGTWDEVLMGPTFKGAPTLLGLEDIERPDECTSILHIEPEWTWWDGEEVTARDIVTTQKITHHFWPNPETFEIIDDKTLKHDVGGPTANEQAYPVDYPVKYKHSYWKDELEKLETAAEEGGDAYDEAKAEFSDIRISLEEKVNEGLGSGLWKPTDWSDTQVIHEKNDGHFRAEWTNLEEWNVRVVPDAVQQENMIKNNKVDLVGGGPEKVPPEGTDLDMLRKFPTDSIRGVTFNARNEHVAKPEVRQAMAYLIDVERSVNLVRDVTGGTVTAPEVVNHVGLTDPVANRWLGKDWMKENLVDYGLGSQPDKAAERMRAAGYTKESGAWVDGDGNEVEDLRFVSGNGEINKALTQYFSSLLEQFGIENTKYFSGEDQKTQRQKQGNYDIWDTGGGGDHFSYVSHDKWKQTTDDTIATLPDSAKAEGCNMADTGQVEYHVDRYPLNYLEIKGEYPTEPKSLDLTGQTKRVNPAKWHFDSRQTADQDEIAGLMREMAKWYNAQVPILTYYHETWGHILDTKHFVNLGPEAEHYARFAGNQMRGLVSAKSESDV